MTQEALKLAIQLRDTASGYWTEQEIPIIDKLIELLAQHDSVQAKPEPEQKPVVLGYMSAGYLYEMQQGRLPYAHVYLDKRTGASVAVYTHPLQPLTDGQKREGFRQKEEECTFRGMTAWQIWIKACEWAEAAHDIKGDE